ncbi:MAG: uracil-DNA glycosylase [Victivallaceae bacterium]|nr:uracil-DNA glycosylase [Victivallaceae bacterium]
MTDSLPVNWLDFLSGTDVPEKIRNVMAMVNDARGSATIFPPRGEVFTAFDLLAPEEVKVVVVGQDPYHGHGEAHGLAFSVRDGVPIPPTLKNIFKELHDDLGYDIPSSGDLTAWARGGVLLINSVLTVESGRAGSHGKMGWQGITDGIISALANRMNGLAFVLWGGYAIGKRELIPEDRGHLVIESPHPSPLSAYRGFLGSRPFSRVERHFASWKWPNSADERQLSLDLDTSRR